MNIDKSYLSRIIKRHENSGYIRRERSAGDGCACHPFLTEDGKARAEDLIRKSNEEIAGVIKGLSSEEAAKNGFQKCLKYLKIIGDLGEHVRYNRRDKLRIYNRDL